MRGAEAKEEKLGLEEYVLALVLHAPLDLAQKTLHKLGKCDFEKETTLNLFEKLKSYLSGRKRSLDIKTFGGKLGGGEKELLGKVYLWGEVERGGLLGLESKLGEELERAVPLLKKRSLQRELKNLSRKIKEAELLGDKKALASARGAFQKTSQQLAKLS